MSSILYQSHHLKAISHPKEGEPEKIHFRLQSSSKIFQNRPNQLFQGEEQLMLSYSLLHVLNHLLRKLTRFCFFQVKTQHHV